MIRRFSTSSYMILSLMLIGMLRNLSNVVIPVLVIGGVIGYNYYLSEKKRKQYTPRYAAPKKKSKTVPFRVINGSKDISDDKPKFH
ncbi:MAG: hypothetical protein H7X86_04530 [Gorillibacterium sp.]|nr:hypothetical protein [Gorillibacterium sp.]